MTIRSARLLTLACFGTPAALWVGVGLLLGSELAISIGVAIAVSGAFLFYLQKPWDRW